MKIITCASYYGCGSSALTDLISEYEAVKYFSNFEFRLLHDIDGVSDLEFHLVECQNRHNSGHALKRFERLSKFYEGNILSKRYSQFFEKDEFRKVTQGYISRLVNFSYPGWWFYDLYDKGSTNYFIYQIFNHIFRKFPILNLKILPNEVTYCTNPSEEEFISITQDYVSKFVQLLNKEHYEFICLDQLVPSSNIQRILRYFKDEIKVVVVDRDPRDIYFSQKYFLKATPVPTNDVETFCKWYLYCRQNGGNEVNLPKNVMKINFEEMIYFYRKSVSKIEEFIGLSPKAHSREFARFNPLRSVVNTKVFEKFNAREDTVDRMFIEKQLEKYLFDFNFVDKEQIEGLPTSELNVF